jgi:hypothetical protein
MLTAYVIQRRRGWQLTHGEVFLAMIFEIMMITLLVVLIVPELAHAATDDVPPESRTLFLPKTQLLVAVVGALTPAISYALNYVGPWLSEKVKSVVLLVVAAVGGALATLLDTGGIPITWNTAQLVGTAVAFAVLAHNGWWKGSTFAHSLGAGRNKQDETG